MGLNLSKFIIQTYPNNPNTTHYAQKLTLPLPPFFFLLPLTLKTHLSELSDFVVAVCLIVYNSYIWIIKRVWGAIYTLAVDTDRFR